jgi:DNA phosphorothioation-dependent restriction protein DptG
MFTHAVLLDVLNHFNFGKLCGYKDIYQLYQNGDKDMRADFYSQVLDLKHKYETEFIKERNISFEPDPEFGDLAGLIRAFFTNMKRQFFHSERDSANKKYPKSFAEFSRNSFLQNRGRNGLMLALNEEQIILLTKIVIKNEQRIKLNELLKGFERRGIYFDKSSKESLVSFYDTLGLIEKKSDSGNAKYVKGIL